MAYLEAESATRENLFRLWGGLLVKHGFILKEDAAGNALRSRYRWDPARKIWKPKQGDYDPDHAMMEYAEEVLMGAAHQEQNTEYMPTGYPTPHKRYHIIYETPNLSIEEVYFWIIDHMRYDQGWTRAVKIKDVFTATENSAFFGMSQQRLGIQQDRVQQYLASIGKMVKDLFQLVRELRIIDEKLHPRDEWERSKSADVTLKGEYVDLVENRGGQTSPASVYGLAQQLGYATLPDLFFNTHITDEKKVDSEIDKLEFNETLKNVLKRKLYQFINWKKKTDHELRNRRIFSLKYLRQHWDVIEMYMSWIKPYLRHIARLTMNDDRLDSIDLIGAFEQAFVETEVLFSKPSIQRPGNQEVVILTIDFRTRPQMSFVQDGYQKGPIHVGQANIYWRAYDWKQHHIDQYVRYRQSEDLYMLGVVDRSVRAAMEALGEELERYLSEAGEPKYKEKVEEIQRQEEAQRQQERRSGIFSGILEPFTALGSGVGDLLGVASFTGPKAKQAPKAPSFPKSLAEGGKLTQNHGHALYQTMKNFKKNHGMLSFG